MPTNTQFVGFIAMSLDGFIADTDGSVRWLEPFNENLASGGDDGGYCDFIASIDALVMGRKTYEQVMGWGWPYEARAGYVLTTDLDFNGDHITAAGDIEILNNAIQKAGHKTVWIMGGGAAQRTALDAGMFHSLRVFIMPTLLGSGRPLFTEGPQRNLKLSSCQALAGGILQIDYNIGD